MTAVIIHRVLPIIQLGHQPELLLFCVEVAGAMVVAAAGWQVAATSIRLTATTTSVFVSLGLPRLHYALLYFYPFASFFKRSCRRQFIFGTSHQPYFGKLSTASPNSLCRRGRNNGIIGKLLCEQSIGFKSLQESMDTTTNGSKLIFHIFGALAGIRTGDY